MQGSIYLSEENSNELPNIDYEIYNKFDEYAEEPIIITVHIFASKNDKVENIAVIKLYVTDASKGKWTIFDIMDGYSADSGIISYMFDTDEYNELINEYLGFDMTFVGVLQEIYVFPKFRKCGMSNWINNNLHSIIKTSMNANVGCLVTQIRPYKEDKYGEYIDADTDNEMTKIMCKSFENNGWREISKKVYIKSFKDYIEL